MARIIIEVSDGYFTERGDLGNINALVKSGEDPTMVFLDTMVFGKMSNLIQNKKEFAISRSCIQGEEDLKIFNHLVRDACALIITDRYEEVLNHSDK